MKLNLLKVRFGQFLLIAGMSSFIFTASAQQAINTNTQADAAFTYEAGNDKTFETAAQVAHLGNNGNKSAAQWDLQFLHNIDGETGAAGTAGAIWTGTEFWVSRWATDSLFSFDTSGTLLSRFTIPTITGTRGMTMDAAGNIWIGAAAGTIYQVNPTTKTVTSTATLPAGVTARFITFDPTANAGAGGFWVANFNTDITLVSMSGTTLATIAAATHTLGGMYGAAVDNISLGGPYLWVFYQPGNPGAIIEQLALPSGAPTGIVFDVNMDLGQTGLAGGLFIDTTIVPGEHTIGGMLQGGDDLFGYELNYAPLQFDAALESMVMNPAVSQVPLDHVTPYSFSGEFRSLGISNLNSVTVKIEISDGASIVFSDSTSYINILPGTVTSYTSGMWTPSALGTYNVTGTVSLAGGGQVDQDLNNDSAFVQILVTDSTFARDDNVVTGSLGIGSTSGPALGILGQQYTLQIADDLTSISFWLNAPTLSEVITASVRDMPSGVPAAIDLATTMPYTIAAGDVNGVFLTLKLNPNSVNLTAGNFFVGVNEPGMVNITLGTTPNYFVPGVTWINWINNPNGAFSNNEDFNFNVVYVLRPNFGVPFTSINEIDPNNVLNMQMYPNPSDGIFTVDVTWERTDDVDILIYDMNGKVVFQDRALNTTSYKQLVDISDKASGNYVLRVVNTNGPNVMPFILE